MQSKGEIIIYQSKENNVSVNVRLEDENVWLTQANLVELFKSSKSNVSEHIKHIFEEDELDEASVVRKFRTTASDGKKYDTTFYNLDLIIPSVIVLNPELQLNLEYGQRLVRNKC